MNRHNGATEFPPRAVARNIGDFAHDVIALSELQAELLAADAQDSLKRIVRPLMAIVVAGIIALGCVPIALAALAFWFVDLGLSNGLAFLLAATAGLSIATVIVVVSWRMLKNSPAVFERSKSEFASNVRWLKTTLTRHRDQSVVM